MCVKPMTDRRVLPVAQSSSAGRSAFEHQRQAIGIDHPAITVAGEAWLKLKSGLAVLDWLIAVPEHRRQAECARSVGERGSLSDPEEPSVLVLQGYGEIGCRRPGVIGTALRCIPCVSAARPADGRVWSWTPQAPDVVIATTAKILIIRTLASCPQTVRTKHRSPKLPTRCRAAMGVRCWHGHSTQGNESGGHHQLVGTTRDRAGDRWPHAVDDPTRRNASVRAQRRRRERE